jgi:hypothetical protein
MQEKSLAFLVSIKLWFNIYFVSDDIGQSMKYYISDTQVREIVGELLFPLISRAKEESEYTRAMGKRLDSIDKAGIDTKKEVMALQTMND